MEKIWNFFDHPYVDCHNLFADKRQGYRSSCPKPTHRQRGVLEPGTVDQYTVENGFLITEETEVYTYPALTRAAEKKKPR